LRIVYCHAPQRVLESRIRQRGRRADDPSEADLEVLHWQERHFTRPAAHEADAILDAAQVAPAELVRRIRAR
ncbi:MAG TPA: AAA family ATPase, partial [Steroidobacteraceae bacterium]